MLVVSAGCQRHSGYAWRSGSRFRIRANCHVASGGCIVSAKPRSGPRGTEAHTLKESLNKPSVKLSNIAKQ